MANFDTTATVQLPITQVAALLTDLRALPTWIPNNWRKFEPLTRTQSGKGSRATFSLNALGMWLPSELEITEATPTRVRWAMAAPPLDLRAVFTLQPQGQGTQVQVEVEWSARPLPPWRVRTHVRLRLRKERDLNEIFTLLAQHLSENLAQARSTTEARGPSLPTQPDAEGFYAAAWVKDVVPGQGLRARLGEKDMALFHLEGHFFAIDNDCAHRQGPLSQGHLDGNVVTCPLHRWRYDVTTGQSVSHPSSQVRAYPTRADDQMIWVKL